MKNMMFSSNENIDYSQSTKKAFGSRKLFLLIMAGLAAVSDLALMIVFAVAGHAGIAIPILLLILDILFIVGVCLSNFRFKYSVGIWVAYIVVSLIVTSILAALEPNGLTYMTATAKGLNVFSHIVLYIVTIFASIYPLIKSNVKVKAAMITCIAVAVILVGAFSVFFSVNGYFGQGFVSGSRVIGYALDEESDTYTAASVKSGRGSEVIIPSQFNGKKVTAVSCRIFTDSSIKSVVIQTSERITFTNVTLLEHINSDIKIGVDKKYVDDFRRECLADTTSFGTYSDASLTFANALYPVNLDVDERYVTFEYTDYPEQDEIIPTWIGKAGQTFDLSFAGLEFMQHADATSDDDLIWCFVNNDAQILAGDLVNLNGKEITEYIDNVRIDFDNVYRISIDEDNDSVYEPADSFKTTLSDSKLYPYKFVTLRTANDVLSNLTNELIADRANAFVLSWQFNFNPTSAYFPDNNWYELTDLFDNLNELARYGGNEVNIKLRPNWGLKTPTNLSVKFDKDSYIYGDDVNMEVFAESLLSGGQMQYSWEWVGDVYGGGSGNANHVGKTYVINNAYPQDGVFSVEVTLSNPQVTSLRSSAIVVVALDVNKRPIYVAWQAPGDMVYSGTEKALTYSVGVGDLINGDTIAHSISETDVRNTDAKSYTAKLALLGEIAEKYYIASGATYAYTITPRSVEAQWTSESFTYDGRSHNPGASAQGVFGAAVPITLSSAKTNAGRYTATATSNDSNYVLTNNTYDFEIKQKSVTVAWDSSTITYNGLAQYPRVSAVNGLVGNDSVTSQLIYSGYSSNINAGEGYTVSVSLSSSSNYKFDSAQSTMYNISRRALSIRAVAPNKTYDGKVNSLDFEVVSGLASVHTKSSLGTPTYSGSGVNAVNVGTYSVEVSLPNNDVTKNYVITYTSTSFTISKAQIALVWSEASVVNGSVTPPSVVSAGQAYAGDINVVSYTYKDASGRVINSIPYANGTYSVEVVATSGNYSFTNTSVKFTVRVEEKEVA